MFQTVPLSIIRSFSLYTQQWYMSYRFADSLRAGSGRNVLILTYTIAVCTVKNSWWWTEELSETCRVLFQKYIWEISATSRFYYKNLSRCTVIWMVHKRLKQCKRQDDATAPACLLPQTLSGSGIRLAQQLVHSNLTKYEWWVGSFIALNKTQFRLT